MTNTELELEIGTLRSDINELRDEKRRLEKENNELVQQLQRRVDDNMCLRNQFNECLEIISRQGVLLGKLQVLVS